MNRRLLRTTCEQPALSFKQLRMAAAFVLTLLFITSPAHAFGFGSKKSQAQTDARNPNRASDAYDDALARIKAGDYAGSIPLLLITAAACGVIKYSINALAASGTGAAVCTPADHTVMCCSCAGSGPT